MTQKRPLLILRVLAELGRGRVRERFIPSETDYYVDGETAGYDITINPIPELVDSVIHELLHRLFPKWPESYVKNRTTFLMKRLSDQEVQCIHDEYQRRKKGKR